MPVRLQSATARLARLNPSLEAFSPNFDGTVDSPASFTATLGANLQGDTASFLGNYQAVSDVTGTIGATLDNFTSNITSSSAPYDLSSGGTRTVHSAVFGYSWPTEPSTSSTINVSANDGAGLATAVATDGARVVVPAGTYTTALTSWGTDVDVVMDNGAVVTGDIQLNGTRTRWTGGNVDNTDFEFNAPVDLLLDNINVLCTDREIYWTVASNAFSRVALINSTLEIAGDDPGEGDGWVIHTSGTNGSTDLIVANCLFSSSDQVLRIQNITRMIMVDTYVNPDNRATGQRLHASMTNLWWADNILVGAFQANRTDPTTNIVNGHFERCTRYDDLQLFMNQGGATNTGTINDSDCFFDVASPNIGAEVSISPFTGSNNIIAAWDGSTLPSTASYGADHTFPSSTVNLVSNTEAFTTGWSNNAGGPSLSTGATNPDGDGTSTRMTRIDGPDDGRRQNITVATNTQHTCSCYLKNVDTVQSDLAMFNNSGSDIAILRIDWTGAVPSQNIAGSTNTSNVLFTHVGDDWYRCSFSFTSDPSDSTLRYIVKPALVAASNGMALDFWGAQLETGTLTGYVPN